MCDKISVNAQCYCSNDVSEAQVYIKNIRSDLQKLLGELQSELSANPSNQSYHTKKMQSSVSDLEKVDEQLVHVHSILIAEPEEQDDLSSNFGISVKLDMAQENLSTTKQKHENMRKEWYSQNDHLNKIASQISHKENELKYQSIFCTTQGLILSKILWKMSYADHLLDKIVAEEKLTLELVRMFGGCLYGFKHTYKDEMPEPSADEYRYVVCLCGFFNNLATTPDGRFFLINQPPCREVVNQIISILPKILVPNTEELKWIMLTALYNIMICKEGEDFVKSNRGLAHSLSECIKEPNTARIITLALKILNVITSPKTPKKTYLKHMSSAVPHKRLEELQQNKESFTIRKEAKQILSSLEAIDCACKPEEGPKNAKNIYGNRSGQKIMAYYALTDTSTTRQSGYSSTEPYSESHETSSSSSSLSSHSSNMEYSNSFPLSLNNIAHSTHSTPISKHSKNELFSRRKNHPKDASPKESCEKSTSTFKIKCGKKKSPISEPSTTTAHLDLRHSSTSEEIQTVQYQFPFTNLNKCFAITIGDNSQNSGFTDGVVRTLDKHHAEGEKTNNSIVTVYRINNSQAFFLSNNSIVPFFTIAANDAATATDSFIEVKEHEDDEENMPSTSTGVYDLPVHDFSKGSSHKLKENLKSKKHKHKKTKTSKNNTNYKVYQYKRKY